MVKFINLDHLSTFLKFSDISSTYPLVQTAKIQNKIINEGSSLLVFYKIIKKTCVSMHDLNHVINGIKMSAMEIKRKKPQDGIAPNSPSHIISALSMPG